MGRRLAVAKFFLHLEAIGSKFPVARCGRLVLPWHRHSTWEVPMNVADLIESRKEVYSIKDDTTVHDAARYLREKQVRSVGICSQDGKLIGVVSQSDISDKVAAENKCPAWMRVSEIMTRDLVTVPPQTPLDACLRLMEQHGIYHLVVQDEKSRFYGMLSVSDLLKVIASDHKARADMLEDLIFPKR
jgi:CBS domain-containing protein